MNNEAKSPRYLVKSTHDNPVAMFVELFNDSYATAVDLELSDRSDQISQG